MNPRKQIGLMAYAMIAAAMCSEDLNIIGSSKRGPAVKPQRDIKAYNESKGLKSFDYGVDKQTVWASNKKNADKKAGKLGYIK